jgi:hypothetical protein
MNSGAFQMEMDRMWASLNDDALRCQGSREFLRCDHGFSPPVIAGRS